MPAPVPIQIRYGDDGLLGAAAAQAGYGQGLLALRDRNQQMALRQQGQDLNFIANNRAQLDQQAIQQQALAQQQNQFQQAHDQFQQAHQPPPGMSGYFEGTGSPLAGAIQKAKQAALATKLNGITLPPDQSRMLDGLVTDEHVPYSQIESIADDIVRKNQAEVQGQAVQQRIAQQQQFEQDRLHQQIAAQQAAADRQALAQQATDTRAGQRQEVAGIDDQLAALNRQQIALQKVVPPGTTPAQFNPAYADPNRATIRTEGVAGSLKDAYAGGGSLVSGGDAAGLAAYAQLATVQRQISDLQAQRQQVLRTQVGQAIVPGSEPAAQQSASSGPVPVNSPEEAAALPSGTQFRTPDGRILVKH